MKSIYMITLNIHLKQLFHERFLFHPFLYRLNLQHNFQYCFSLKAGLGRHLFINDQQSFADKAWQSSLLALPSLFCFFQALILLLRIPSYKKLNRIYIGSTMVPFSCLLHVYVPYLTFAQNQTAGWGVKLFFFFSFLLKNRFWRGLLFGCIMSNGIRKASWKEEHVTVDSPDTDQCKLLQISTLRKNQKTYSGEKKKWQKTKPKKDGILNSHNFSPATYFSSLPFCSEKEKETHWLTVTKPYLSPSS